MDFLEYAKVNGFTEKQNTSVIKVIYKKDDADDLVNYRPIALINTDMKILTKVLANRLKEVLPSIIHYTQTCVKGRKIDTTIHTVRDLIQLAEDKNLDAAFIFLDQEKAFDRVNHEFLIKVMLTFNIGKNFINWIQKLYQNALSQVIINGHLTKSFKLARGVRQGDPLSALLYVMVIEILAIQIRANPNIIGFTIKKEKLVSFHYADDTTIAITQNKCWKEVIKELNLYESATGAKINKKKTFGLWTGNWKNRSDKPMGISWTSGNVKALGIYLGNQKPGETLLKEIYEKIETSLNFWKSFYLSKFAKARILEIFISSKLWYAAKFIPIPANYQTMIQKKFNQFIIYPYNSNLIAEKELFKLREDGGIKLIHVQTKALSSKIKWLIDVTTNDTLQVNKDIIDELIGTQTHGHYGLDNLYTTKYYVTKLKINSAFYSETLKACVKLYPRKKIENIEDECVLDNSIFKNRQNKPFNSTYLNKNEIWTYGSLVREQRKRSQDLPHDKKLTRLYDIIVIDQDRIQNFFSLEIRSQDDMKHKEMSLITEKELYVTQLKTNYYALHTSEIQWMDYFMAKGVGITFNEVWRSLNSKILNENTRTLIWEQIHLNFFNTYWFNKIGRVENSCPLCKSIPNSKKHIIIECDLVKKLWNEIEGVLLEYDPTRISESEMCFGLLGRKLKIEQEIRNWLTFKLRECTGRQERLSHDKPGINNEKQIKLKFNKEIAKELTYKYYLYKKDNNLDTFYKTFNCKRELISVQGETIIIAELFNP